MNEPTTPNARPAPRWRAHYRHFIHVYVDRATRHSTPLPARLVQTLQGLL